MKKTNIIIFLFLTLGIVSCFKSGSGSNIESNAPQFSGPGSFWTAQIGNSTFTMEQSATFGAAVDLTVSGTVSDIPAGFKVLTVSSAAGTNAPAIGDQGYAFVIPGLVTLVRPMNATGDKLLPMLVSGDCPTTNQTFNWLVTDSTGGNLTDGSEDVIGEASFNASTNEYVPGDKWDLSGNLNASVQAPLSSNCNNGFTQIAAGGGNVNMWLSQSGGAIIHVSANDQVILAMPSDSVNAASLSNKEFYGIMLNEANTPKVSPVWLEMGSSGTTANAARFTDVLNNIKGSPEATLTFDSFDSPKEGFVRTTVTAGTDTAKMTCQYKSNINNSGKDTLFCAGHVPGVGNEALLYNLMLVEK